MFSQFFHRANATIFNVWQIYLFLLCVWEAIPKCGPCLESEYNKAEEVTVEKGDVFRFKGECGYTRGNFWIGHSNSSLFI